MARTSQRLSSSSAASWKHKRMISSDASTTKASKRSRIAASDQDESADSVVDGGDEDEDSEASDFAEKSSSSEASSEEEDDYDSEEDRPKPRKKPTPKKGTPRSTANGAEVWREGVSAGLGPGNQVIIKKPKARSAGKTPYRDDTLHPNTFDFLTDLKANNQRQWLKMNDLDFRQAEKDWFSFVEKLMEKLSEVDETIPELPVKDVIFRIYRDVRFSPDPTPYKPHFSAYFSRTGRKGPYAGYYVQIGGEESLVAGGSWFPEAAPLAALRREIDSNPRRFKDVLLNDGIRREYLNNSPKTHAKVVKAFASVNAEGALKTKPKGYDADHPDIELLRIRSFIVTKKLTREDLLDNGLDRLTELFACLQPLVAYLNSILMPDPEDDDDDDGEEQQEDDSSNASD